MKLVGLVQNPSISPPITSFDSAIIIIIEENYLIIRIVNYLKRKITVNYYCKS
jgi:hypothetical protein